MSTGISWRWMEEVAYDDSMILVFKHPTDSSIAAITVEEDLDLTKTDASNFRSLKMKPLDRQVAYKMDYQDVELYDQFYRDLQLQKDWVQA